MKRILLTFTIITCLSNIVAGKSKITEDFTPVCDSLSVLIRERTGIKGPVKLKAIMKRGSELDFYFTESLGDFPWYKGDVKWFKSKLKHLFPEGYGKYRIGEIYSRRVSLEHLVMPDLSYSGKAADNRFRVNHTRTSEMIVNRTGSPQAPKGLHGRHIALWQSHGRYYDCGSGEWIWQRPCIFRTC